MDYFIHQNGETYGPYPIDALRSMWASGQVISDALFCEEGSEEWRQLDDLRHDLEAPQHPPPPVSPRSFTPQKKRGLRREFLIPGLVIASVIFLFAVLGSILSRSENKERAIAKPQAKSRGADELLADAESALRGREFARSANSLNRISSQYPDSRQAGTVRDLALFLRDGNISQTGPITVGEAERLRSLMVALDNIRTSYRTATRQKRRALEAIFGRETFQRTDTGLDSLSTSAAKLRDARDEALQDQR